MPRRVAGSLLVLLLATACASPEARRARGGGPGADTGNRGATVVFHDGAEPYYKTPCATKPVKCEGPRPVFGTTWKPD
jgi:hypothetical protein